MRERIFWLAVTLVYFGHFSIYLLVNALWWVVRAPFRLVRWLWKHYLQVG